MIIQGSNLPLALTFSDDISQFPTIVATLWKAAGEKLKEWTLADMEVEDNVAYLPLTEAETTAFPTGIIALEVKALDEDGGTAFWEECSIQIVPRRDKAIALTE